MMVGESTEKPELPPGAELPSWKPDKVVGILPPWRAILWALETSEWEILVVGLAWREAHPADQREGDWLRWLAGLWLTKLANDAAAELERERELEANLRSGRSMIIRPRAKDARGDRYVALDRGFEEAAAVFAGSLVKVAGERYPDTPAVVERYRPWQGEIVPKSILDRKRNALIPGLEPPAVREFLSLTATKAVGLEPSFPRLTAKLVPVMFGTIGGGDHLVSGTLDELTKLLNPRINRIRKRDRETAALALVSVDGLRLIERQDNGRLIPYRLFSINYEFSTEPDARVGWTLDPWFKERMTKGGTGYFIVNIDRLLTLDTQKPEVIALYLNLAGWWHTVGKQRGTFHPDRCKPRRLIDLAAEINALSPTAAEYVRKGRGDRRRASESMASMKAHLEALREAGLLGTLEFRGKGLDSEVIILPDDGYIEACRRAHQRPKR